MTGQPSATAADLKARVVTAMARAVDSGAVVERVRDAPAPAGYSMWRIGRSATVLPTLLSSAPFSVHRRYLARVVANITGT